MWEERLLTLVVQAVTGQGDIFPVFANVLLATQSICRTRKLNLCVICGKEADI